MIYAILIVCLLITLGDSMPVKALIDALNKESQLKQTEEINQAKQELATHPVDAIKNDILRLAEKNNLILAPLPLSNKNNEQNQNDNALNIELVPDLAPQPQPVPNPELNNMLTNPAQIPTLKLSFVAKTKEALDDKEEAKLLEANKLSLENSFETLKKELDAQNMLSNNFTAKLSSGAFTANTPFALYNSAAIEQLFNKFLEFAPRMAPQAAKSHIVKNDSNNQSPNPLATAQQHEKNSPKPELSDAKEKIDAEKSSFHPSPFSMRPKPPGTI